MSLRDFIKTRPLYWRINVFVTGLLIFVVGLTEIVLEPLATKILTGLYGSFQPWHEVVLWGVSILIPALACSYVLSRMLSSKLEKMARISRELAYGNLHARFSVSGNDQDAFDVLAQNFNEMAEAIEKQRNNERRLLADISHELRSPLARMTIAAELLPRRNGLEERANITLRLNREIGRMNELVSLLLIQGRDRFLASDTYQPVDLEKILQELADDFAFQGESQNKRVETELQGRLTATGNPLLLRRMFSNILSNAIFYTPVDNKIKITGTAANGNIVVAIRDYGPGVAEEQLEDIFRAFYRVDNSRSRASGGVGLGLALVREAAIAHNGSVEAENASPGLLVTVTLPACKTTQLKDSPAK